MDPPPPPPPPGIIRDILGPILKHRRGEVEESQKHRLDISAIAYRVDQPSVQYLVDFLQEPSHEITELNLSCFWLSHPSDGGLNILRDFFVNTTVENVHLTFCNFGTNEDASHLLGVFESNESVKNLTISFMFQLEGGEPALDACLSGIIQRNSHLQKLNLGYWRGQALHSLQPGLQANNHLKCLCIGFCELVGHEICFLAADALVGITTSLDELTLHNSGLSNAQISANSLTHIARLLQATQLKRFGLRGFYICEDDDKTREFIRVLSRNEFLTSLTIFGGNTRQTTRIAVADILMRNRNLIRADALLAVQNRTGKPIPSKSGLWYKAFAKLANGLPVASDDADDDATRTHTGASAIFKILQSRPTIPDKQVQRPAAASVHVPQQQQQQQQQHESPQHQGQNDAVVHDNDDVDGMDSGNEDGTTLVGRKRKHQS